MAHVLPLEPEGGEPLRRRLAPGPARRGLSGAPLDGLQSGPQPTERAHDRLERPADRPKLPADRHPAWCAHESPPKLARTAEIVLRPRHSRRTPTASGLVIPKDSNWTGPEESAVSAPAPADSSSPGDVKLLGMTNGLTPATAELLGMTNGLTPAR